MSKHATARMRRVSWIFAAVAALTLALAPGFADARAGFGRSFGSRGGMTWSAPRSTPTAPYGAEPMQRSFTPSPASPAYGAGATAYRARSGFMSGLVGGLVGAGLLGLLFGGGLWGGLTGFGGFLGLLLQIGLIVLLVRFLVRRFAGRSPSFAGPGTGLGAGPFAGAPRAGASAGGSPAAPTPIAVGPADHQAFEQALQGVQAAWSAHDLDALRAMVTPEMLSYFSEQIAEQARRGVRNEARDVQFLQGDVAEAWSERGRDYATVAMRYSLIDVTRDRSGRIVEGDVAERVSATELWTFVRSPGGRWLLSAIQQAR